MGYPAREHETGLALRMLGTDAPEAALEHNAVQPVLSSGELERVRGIFHNITVREELVSYIVDIVRRTREEDTILVGAGPRATQALLLSGRAHAALAGRDFVTPDDVKAVASAVLEHRLVLRPESEIEGVTAAESVERVLR